METQPINQSIEEYTIDCTGDACIDDEVKFEKAIFTEGKRGFRGRFKPGKFIGTETIYGTIIKDSYGKDKQQHTFTLLDSSENKMLIKGRNLYRNGCFRKPWDDESKRQNIINEKHERGDVARADRLERKTRQHEFTDCQELEQSLYENESSEFEY